MKKKLLALLLSLTFIMSMFTGCGAGNSNPKLSQYSTLTDAELELIANAEKSGTCGENTEWYFKDNTLIIVGTGKVETNSWSSKKFKAWEEVEELIIDEGITELPEQAFFGFSFLSYVKLPSTLEVISEDCFGYCMRLTEITIPENVKRIEQGALVNDLKAIIFMSKNVDDIEIDKSAFMNKGNDIEQVAVYEESDKLKELFENAEFIYASDFIFK